MTPVKHNRTPRSEHIFAHRVLDLVGAVFVFAWCAVFTIVLIGWALTAAR